MERQSVKVDVFSGQRYDGDWPPNDAAGFIAWFQGKIDTIPAEHRSDARIELDSESSYEDSHYASIGISYWRPETDGEMEARAADVRARIAHEIARLELRLKQIKGE
jgi:hypothetical protein